MMDHTYASGSRATCISSTFYCSDFPYTCRYIIIYGQNAIVTLKVEHYVPSAHVLDVINYIPYRQNIGGWAPNRHCTKFGGLVRDHHTNIYASMKVNSKDRLPNRQIFRLYELGHVVRVH